MGSLTTLLKIPVSFFTAYVFNSAMTPPHVAQSSEAIDPREKRSSIMLLLPAALARSTYWAISLAEGAMIIAKLFPNEQPKHIASFLCSKPLDFVLPNIQATPQFYLGSTLLLSGALLRLWCFRELGRFFTFVATIQKDHKLITSGPYAYVRHPAYSGLALSLIGFVGCHLTPGTWLRECGLLDTRAGVVGLVGLMSAGPTTGQVTVDSLIDAYVNEEKKLFIFIDKTLTLVLRPLALLLIEMRIGIISTALLALSVLPTMAASLTELQPRDDGDTLQALRRRATYHSCSNQQIASLYNAVGETMAYARSSYAYAADNTAGASDRFTTWFGRDNASFFNTTTSRYAAIVANFKALASYDFTKLTYDCGTCSRDDVYGSVFLQQPSIVYLCKPFWKAPLTGSYSQAGTLLSLVAQNRDVAGLSTFATEKLTCQRLAIDSPNLAVQNAASYQFFAENSPAL
ncbi:hypothetical protein EST38_g7593 [Candolleomyces aberdarensis]|uniref:Protein-S-isoprenylcysteine O-methyltransferase n=1 Tax=Candolleomyces aberdarensis TaxID=2316362 RepID=A0A4Q2DEU7_9AGAR|nr:hypothetical protein EST38_g7593 [Candolleomyces aberdarensis]